ncbi:4-hydroxy-tetrahydrodipicolinate synthase [Candidatus Rickettsiella viridis]|nr:4-hydroxy-tetrahydrodipicolinate synthase [Candidatus Rickettsiella viridis]
MFHGSMVALLTPMRENGDIDYLCLRHLVDWHVAQGTDAILVMGTTGEPATLSAEEKENVIKTVVEQVHGRIPVIAGTGTNSTQSSIDQTRKAMEIGVQACLLVTPYYNCPTQEGLYQHYRSIAEKVPIPQILYNIPKRTGVDLLPETVSRLAGIANIVGIKEGRPACAKAIIEYCGTNIDIYSGDDNAALEIIRLGGKGVVSVLANLLPKAVHELCETARNADWDKEEALEQQLRPFYGDLFVETNPIPVKWLAAEHKLIPTPHLRLPLTTLSSEQQTNLKPLLNRLTTFT